MDSLQARLHRDERLAEDKKFDLVEDNQGCTNADIHIYIVVSSCINLISSCAHADLRAHNDKSKVFRVESIDGDGACMFASVAYILQHLNIMPAYGGDFSVAARKLRARAKCVEFMVTSFEWLCTFSSIPVTNKGIIVSLSGWLYAYMEG
jgi:hypothetical protein